MTSPGGKARAAVIALRLMARLPLPLAHALGGALGWLAWLIPNSQRRIAAINLEYCWPELSARARQGLLRRGLIESGKTALELGALWLWPPQRTLGLIRAIEGEAAWRAALAQGRGAIIVTPHLGAWELAGLYLSQHYSLTGMYRPSRVGGALDGLIRVARERCGARFVPTDVGGVRALLHALRAGGVVGLLPDQNPAADGGVFAPFFGQPAYTMVLLSRLAQKTRAPVFLVVAERLSWGCGYHLRFTVLPEAVSLGSLEHSVSAVNFAVEQAVRCLPEQYLWSYKRFKSQPPGAVKLYSNKLRQRYG